MNTGCPRHFLRNISPSFLQTSRPTSHDLTQGISAFSPIIVLPSSFKTTIVEYYSYRFQIWTCAGYKSMVKAIRNIETQAILQKIAATCLSIFLGGSLLQSNIDVEDPWGSIISSAKAHTRKVWLSPHLPSTTCGRSATPPRKNHPEPSGIRMGQHLQHRCVCNKPQPQLDD